MAKYRGRRIQIDVTADVYMDDVLSELDSDMLRDECKARGIKTSAEAGVEREAFFDLMDEMRGTFADGDRIHFEVLLIRLQTLAGVERLTVAKRVEA